MAATELLGPQVDADAQEPDGHHTDVAVIAAANNNQKTIKKCRENDTFSVNILYCLIKYLQNNLKDKTITHCRKLTIPFELFGSV